jgi:hypothetical protein
MQAGAFAMQEKSLCERADCCRLTGHVQTSILTVCFALPIPAPLVVAWVCRCAGREPVRIFANPPGTKRVGFVFIRRLTTQSNKAPAFTALR